jgi:hypothetical protein
MCAEKGLLRGQLCSAGPKLVLFPKKNFSFFLEYWTMNKVQEPSDSEGGECCHFRNQSY